jgi:hypothetical protein
MFTSRFTFRTSRILVGALLLVVQGLALVIPTVAYGQWGPPPEVPKLEIGFDEILETADTINASDTGIAESAVLNPGDTVKVDWGCNPLTLSFAGCLTGFLYAGMTWAAALSSATGRLLNTAILMLVVDMNSAVGSGTTGGTAVEDAWTILRDLANVLLVFLTVFIGLATIVGVTRYGYKQLLFKVVLAALFVNFSITLARVVIDTSNILALSIFVIFFSLIWLPPYFFHILLRQMLLLQAVPCRQSFRCISIAFLRVPSLLSQHLPRLCCSLKLRLCRQ